MSNVVQFPTYQYVAMCPMCGGSDWMILMSKAQPPNQRIVEIECSNCSAMMILDDIEVEKK